MKPPENCEARVPVRSSPIAAHPALPLPGEPFHTSSLLFLLRGSRPCIAHPNRVPRTAVLLWRVLRRHLTWPDKPPLGTPLCIERAAAPNVVVVLLFCGSLHP